MFARCTLFLVAACAFLPAGAHPVDVPTASILSRATDLAAVSQEPRQLGLFGAAALGALMFPIFVSLGMATFVSHLPTVFKEFAAEFGIPTTPSKFQLFRNGRSYEAPGQNIDDLAAQVFEALGNEVYFN